MGELKKFVKFLQDLSNSLHGIQFRNNQLSIELSPIENDLIASRNFLFPQRKNKPQRLKIYFYSKSIMNKYLNYYLQFLVHGNSSSLFTLKLEFQSAFSMHPQNAKENFNADSTVILSGPGNVKHRKEKHLTAVQWQARFL